MPRHLILSLLVTAVLLAAAGCAHSRNEPVVTAPFDAHRDQVGLDVVVEGRSLRFILDSAVDPSLIDTAAAKVLALPRLSGDWGVDGVGRDQATAYDSRLERVKIGPRFYGPIKVAVGDMGRLRQRYGRPLHGVLGYSFLRDRVVAIDYVRDRVTIYENPAVAQSSLARCGKVHRLPMAFVENDTIILIPGLTIGSLATTAILDTGSSNGLRLWEDAPELAAIRDLLPAGEAGTSVGARGETASRTGVLALPVTLGPFVVRKVPVTLAPRSSGGARAVNIGNRFLRAAGVTLLLDYPSRQVGFYGDCR